MAGFAGDGGIDAEVDDRAGAVEGRGGHPGLAGEEAFDGGQFGVAVTHPQGHFSNCHDKSPEAAAAAVNAPVLSSTGSGRRR